MFSRRRGWAALLLGFVLVGKSSAINYYVSSSGNDANSGTATTAPWKTISKVNSRSFSAGDQIFFAGGQTFAGTITFDASDHGTPASPIVVTSYGTGRATISAGNTLGFSAYNCAGLIVSNLNFVGAGPTVNSKDGISFYNDLSGNTKLPMIILDHIDVSGFGGFGIVLGAWNQQAGFRDVWIMNTASHDNLRAGIATYAQVANSHTNIYVGLCSAYNNFGDPNATGNTGSGIVLGDVIGGTVEWCVAYENGKNNFVQSEGPVGIWAYDSSNIKIQFNEAHHNHTSGRADGDGFDLDINVKNSVMQYNYSHDNDGSGYLLCCDGNNLNNVIRYNVSQNDARKNGYGAIHTYGNNNGSEIFNNTVFLSQTTSSPSALLLVTGTTNIRVRNNIFVTTGGAKLLSISSGQNNLLLQGNDYWSSGAAFNISYNGANYTAFDAWRNASGQEHINGNLSGYNVDPKLTSAGGGGTFNDAAQLGNLSAYQLQNTSPMIDHGINLAASFGEVVGTNDFFLGGLPQGSQFDIGAHEFKAAIASSPLKIDSAKRMNGGSFQLNFSGPIGVTNVVEVSTNLVNWSVWTNCINAIGSVQITDPNAGNFSKRFYRLRQN